MTMPTNPLAVGSHDDRPPDLCQYYVQELVTTKNSQRDSCCFVLFVAAMYHDLECAFPAVYPLSFCSCKSTGRKTRAMTEGQTKRTRDREGGETGGNITTKTGICDAGNQSDPAGIRGESFGVLPSKIVKDETELRMAKSALPKSTHEVGRDNAAEAEGRESSAIVFSTCPATLMCKTCAIAA